MPMQFLPHWRIGLKASALVSLTLFCAASNFAQSLGDIARQERERKKEQPPRATYVYTNDDLRRWHILVPEDKARVLAARNSASTPAVQVAQIPVPAPPVLASPAPVSVPPVPASVPPAFASVETVVPTPAALKTPPEPEALPEDSARNRPQTQLSTQSVVTSVPSEALLSPPAPKKAPKKTVRPAIATGLVSGSDFSRHHLHRAILEREPADSGLAASGMSAVITVERGDSLWKLAKRYLGKGARWRELAALNTQILNANVLRVGEWICLPAGDLQTARQTIIPRARAPGSIAQASSPITSPSVALTAQIASRRLLAQP
jgi:nucleoid-associated protein YgaU